MFSPLFQLIKEFLSQALSLKLKIKFERVKVFMSGFCEMCGANLDDEGNGHFYWCLNFYSQPDEVFREANNL